MGICGLSKNSAKMLALFDGSNLYFLVNLFGEMILKAVDTVCKCSIFFSAAMIRYDYRYFLPRSSWSPDSAAG
jgi:hypothetical protein